MIANSNRFTSLQHIFIWIFVSDFESKFKSTPKLSEISKVKDSNSRNALQECDLNDNLPGGDILQTLSADQL